METIIGIEIFPIISFIIFFLFFCVLFIWVMRLQNTTIEQIAALPLQDLEEKEVSNQAPNTHRHE